MTAPENTFFSTGTLKPIFEKWLHLAVFPIYISLVLSHELGYRDCLFVSDSGAVNYMDAYDTKTVYHTQRGWEWCVLANEFATISRLLLLWWRWMGGRRRRPTNTVKLTIFPVTLIQNFKNSCRCKCLHLWSCHQWWLILQQLLLLMWPQWIGGGGGGGGQQ